MKRMVEYVEGRVAIHIIAEELDSTGQPYPLDHHDCLFTEDNDADADADTYDDSDVDGCCRLWRRRALSTGGHSAS